MPVVQRLKAIWRDDLQAYLLLWFAFVFVFFSLSGTKLPHYLLYGMTGLVILVALYGRRAARARSGRFRPRCCSFSSCSAPQIVEWTIPRIRDAYYREALSGAGAYFDVDYFVFCGAGLALTLYGMFERRFAPAQKLAAAGLLSVIARYPTSWYRWAPASCRSRSRRPRPWRPSARAQADVWRLNAPSFSVYHGRPTASREPGPGDVVITKARRLVELPAGSEVLYSKNGIVLIRIGR